jgi:two-component system nitrogen regulation sensor histidine kinase NtrY
MLLLAALGVGTAAVADPRRPGRAWRGGAALVVVAILAGFVAHRQVARVLDDWDGYWDDRVREVEVDLSEELNRRQAAGEAASDALAALWSRAGASIDVDDVAGIRSREAASAVALYDRGGKLVVWDGVHRGKVPEEVQRGERRHSYRDLPLFGYLYVTSVADDGAVAVAAYLLRAALPEGLRADMRNLSARFFQETGERIRITEEDPGVAEVVWDLALDDDRLLSVVLERPGRLERAATILDGWRIRIGLLVVVSWILLAVGAPATLGGALVAAGGLIALATWLPLDQVEAVAHLFDPEVFQLPGTALTLGRFAVVALAGFTLVAVLPRPSPVLSPLTAGAVVGVVFPAVSAWVSAGTTTTALAGGRSEWIAYEVGVAALLSLVVGTVMALTRKGDGEQRAIVGAALISALLGACVAAWVSVTATHPVWWPALWSVPVGLAVWGVRAWSGWRRAWVAWAISIVVGGSAAIPIAWSHRFDARVAAGRERLETLRSADHPELEQALFDFGRIADSLDLAGASDVSILYDGWVRSGLAALGHPVWLQIHRPDGTPGEGLRVGVEGAEPQSLGEILYEGWSGGGIQLFQPNRGDARYILTSMLSDLDLVSAVVPPFPVNNERSGLGPLLQGARDEDPLTVLPLLPGDPAHEEVPELLKGREGWQVEIRLDFEDGQPYHAHYVVGLPSLPLGAARAGLLLAMNFVLFVAFWIGGRGLLREPAGKDVRLSGLVISFRARVTLALFGFFALANALFGTVAYQTLAEASRRSAQVIAERVVDDAAGWYRTRSGEMERLATQVGAELLEYRDAELREGSVEELVELGLYEAWIPYDLYRELEGREIENTFEERSVGRWEYVTAFRRLPDADILAAQVPLQAGSSALQTTDLIELLGFIVLLGAALSLGLAMMAGRALTRPIHALLVASESVGAGDLGLRLPSNRADEFGAVFRAFNRMVGRVRRARRQLVRTSRRTQLIMDEAAVGMVALDAGGRVTLVNPRAEELLGTEVFVGRHLPDDGVLGEALTGWLADYLDGRADEAGTDFQVGERRVRVRARRLGSVGTRRGVVVALDDVTDELRAERVLAWGEMARQVAHEVKNPLTPIKLSIQHVRRAWEDERPDFEDILIKNADAMLSEIDRLAGIAQSFSRFGAPGGDQVVPLEGVSVADIVGEVMALYGGGASGVRFEDDLPEDLPRVVARPAELKEVLVNLLENARLAGEDGTSVRISARRQAPDTVVLRVVDDGDGIPADILPRIFEPQFSTRSTGTGLGLAIVQRVVRTWGGAVSVESVAGEGTTVSVSLRVWPEQSRHREPSAALS